VHSSLLLKFKIDASMCLIKFHPVTKSANFPYYNIDTPTRELIIQAANQHT